jgi:hypothetical protein
MDPKDRVYLLNSIIKNQPLRNLTIDVAIGFSKLCSTDETFDERLSVRRDLTKNLRYHAKMFNLYLV